MAKCIFSLSLSPPIWMQIVIMEEICARVSANSVHTEWKSPLLPNWGANQYEIFFKLENLNLLLAADTNKKGGETGREIYLSRGDSLSKQTMKVSLGFVIRSGGGKEFRN